MSTLRALVVVASAWMLLLGAHAAKAPGPSPQPCLDVALAALPMARQLLQAHGEFAPYGVGFTATREMVGLDPAAAPASRETARRSAVDELRSALEQAMEAQRWQATALVYEATVDAHLDAASDAIAVAVEHRGGCSAVVAYPYRFDNGQLELGPAEVIQQRLRAAERPRRRP